MVAVGAGDDLDLPHRAAQAAHRAAALTWEIDEIFL
jgi:hypothetical protein